MSVYGPIDNLRGIPDEKSHAALAAELEGEGALLADRVLETPWTREESVEARYHALFAGVRDGFSFMALHPNAPGEVEAIEPETAQIRIEEYDMLAGAIGARLIEALPARRVGMRALRDGRRASKLRAASA